MMSLKPKKICILFIGLVLAHLDIRLFYQKKQSRMYYEIAKRRELIIQELHRIIQTPDLSEKIARLNNDDHHIRVAIYGMSEIGMAVMESILSRPGEIELLYGIDKRAKELYTYIPIYTLNEASERIKPQIVILTVLDDDDKLRLQIERELGSKVVSIGDMLGD